MWSVQMGDIHPRATPFAVALSLLVLAFRAVNEGITNTGCTFSVPKLCQNRATYIGHHTTDA